MAHHEISIEDIKYLLNIHLESNDDFDSKIEHSSIDQLPNL
jgi:hypothetical protein